MEKLLPREQGERYETLVADYLVARGLRLVERNFAKPFGEVDLILEQGETLVFVEVRYRRSVAFGDPVETVDQAKRRRIIRAAVAYLADRRVRGRDCRFDVASVVQTAQGPRIEHYPNAFEANLGFGSFLLV